MKDSKEKFTTLTSSEAEQMIQIMSKEEVEKFKVNMKDESFLDQLIEDEKQLLLTIGKMREKEEVKGFILGKELLGRKKPLQKSHRQKLLYVLGMFYFRKKSKSDGISYLKDSAKLGFITAMQMLGHYERAKQGSGNKRAMQWYRKAANLGDVECNRYLAEMMLDQGDHEKAIARFLDAADNHLDTVSMHKLAYIYEKGLKDFDGALVVAVDMEKSFAYYKKAAKETVESCYNVGVILIKRAKEDIKDNPNDNEGIKKKLDEGFKYLLDAGDRKFGPACHFLATELISSDFEAYGSYKDCKKAIEYLKLGADESHNPDCMYLLGLFYGMKGEEVPKELVDVVKEITYNLEESIRYLKNGANLNHEGCLNALKMHTK